LIIHKPIISYFYCDKKKFLRAAAVFYVAGFGYVVEELLHVPGGGWAAFCTEAAV
jgi:hypothetical protein